MPMIHVDALDAALDEIRTNATVLHICDTEPTDYASISSLGSKSSPSIGSPETGDTSGRKVVVASISDGTVSADGTAGYWALADASRLLAAGALTSTQAVTNGNTFTLTAFDVEIQDPS